MVTSNKYPPVMILGCGRSGTSIFGELFEGLADYQYISEPPFAQVVSSFGYNRAVKVPVESPGYPADLGLTFPLADLLGVHPDTVFFWIARHPLDAICSLRIGIGDGWRHHPRPPDWQTWLARDLVEQCAHHWAYINGAGYEAVQAHAKLVFFEDMIESPSSFAAGICAHIGIDTRTVHDVLGVWSRRVQDTNNSQFIEAQTSRKHSRPDHSIRVGRWRENLSNAEVEQVWPIVMQTSRDFGYQPEASGH